MEKSVLIIDDDKVFSGALRSMLKSNGFNVNCCEGGTEALNLLRDKGMDAIVIDYYLPTMNGAQITSIIRTQHPGTLLIGFSLRNKEKEFIAAGANAFYVKPLVSELLAHISRCA